MIDHAKITICGNCEHSEQTRWGLLCRRLARQDPEGDVDDLYVAPLDFCCWGTPLVGDKVKVYLMPLNEDNFTVSLMRDDPYILTSEGEKRLDDMTIEKITEALIKTKGEGTE